MPENRTARSRGRQIDVAVDDDGIPTVTVDGESVPVRVVDGKYAVAYLEPADDLMESAKRYVGRLA